MYECIKCGFHTGDKTEIDSLKKISVLQHTNEQLKTACEVALLAITHKPIHPDDIKAIQAAIKAARDAPV